MSNIVYPSKASVMKRAQELADAVVASDVYRRMKSLEERALSSPMMLRSPSKTNRLSRRIGNHGRARKEVKRLLMWSSRKARATDSRTSPV